MYKKFILGGLTAVSLVILSSENLASALSATNVANGRKCQATNDYKLGRKSELVGDRIPRSPASPADDRQGTVNFNFADYLSIEVSSGIVARFTPRNSQNKPIELYNLAKATGYRRFDWVNYVEQDPYGITDKKGNLLSLPYNDPPPGGYQYGAADSHPFYWDIEPCQNCHSRHYYQHPEILQKHTLTFEDHPSDYRLQTGESVKFVTHLVGVKADESPTSNGRATVETKSKQSRWEVLSTFEWQLTNDATGKSQVSLIASDRDLAELSPSLLAQIQKDGGIIPRLDWIAHRNKYTPDSHQCLLQSHQNQHLDSHL